MMNNKNFIGEVYYNNDEFIIKESFSLVDSNEVYIDDERSRCAYMIISKSEAKNLCENLDDKQKVLNSIKDKYGKIVREAIKEEEKYKKTNKDSFLSSVNIDKKIVYLQSIPIRYGKKFESFLKSLKFYSACKNLENEKKQEDINSGVAYLNKSKNSCNNIIKEEINRFNKNIKDIDKQAYALIIVPYVYNKENNKMVLTIEENSDSVTLMPKTQVEYGVFFDGTNNNMYNVKFYQDYKDYITSQCEYIKNNYTKNRKFKEYQTSIDIITHHPDPENYPNIMNLVRNEIIDKITYFEPKSKIKDNYEDNNNASKDAKEVFKFLLEVRNTLKGEDSFVENMIEKIEGVDAVTGKEKEIKELIIKKILPSNSKSSSYTNGYTNVKRLYDHYEGKDSLEKNENAHKYDLKRFKVYAAGSGTVDPFENSSLDKDSIFGLGLGVGKTGIDAHILYICHKIATELRKEKINQINELVFDIFGFSRGATEARHFICSIQKEFELIKKEDEYLKYALNTKEKDIFSCFFPYQDGLYTKIENRVFFNPLRTDIKQIKRTISAGSRTATIYEENPYFGEDEISIDTISFRHANIVDTVTHYGVRQSDDWKDLRLEFDKNKIGSVFHLMAADEYRYNFEAYSIFKDKNKAILKEDGNLKEFIVPGAHADVGGGYENFGNIESVKVLEYYSGNNNKIKAWNNKYGWLENTDKLIKGTNSLYELKEDGIFYEKSRNYNQINTSGAYMCRTNISWEYELVILNLLHKIATDKDKKRKEEDRVPLKRNLDEKYKLSTLKQTKKLKDEDFDLLSDINKKIQAFEKIDDLKYKKLRKKFIHHSSDFNLVNKPSIKGNERATDEIYGKRVIYNLLGENINT
ncbi:hypothetical protein CPU12_03110 [Malaciobacter molluscorum LMG 25693]|uniref:T6SS Phospholipase effector Tle1-like catalytic domain-containing protein n=2 Tax=Malaciobacter molluscorum LMG 25693 TaxID=870501 RepID=A0A2G1DK12_9BACT|nr:DUF2235 domain-containing protein [Malaciobacter molluscorum]PHO18863.1 hypothetical protein CPU12_03110 [Malaciobacter molluscorum LMG 25693]